MYLFLNSDGSIKQIVKNEYIMQYANNVNTLFVNMDNIVASEWVGSCAFTQPETATPLQLALTQVSFVYNGTTYQGYKLDLTQDMLSKYGTASVNVILTETSSARYVSASFDFIINQTALPTSWLTNLNTAEYQALWSAITSYDSGTYLGSTTKDSTIISSILTNGIYTFNDTDNNNALCILWVSTNSSLITQTIYSFVSPTSTENNRWYRNYTISSSSWGSWSVDNYITTSSLNVDFYTKTQIDTMLGSYATLTYCNTTFYTQAQIDTMLGSYATLTYCNTTFETQAHATATYVVGSTLGLTLLADGTLQLQANGGTIVSPVYLQTMFAKINSPTFTGTPTAPTPSADDNSTKIATTAFVVGRSSQVVKSLDTTSSSALTPTTESIGGSGTIQLHKISKTGSTTDLLQPTITSNHATSYAIPLGKSYRKYIILTSPTPEDDQPSVYIGFLYGTPTDNLYLSQAGTITANYYRGWTIEIMQIQTDEVWYRITNANNQLVSQGTHQYTETITSNNIILIGMAGQEELPFNIIELV